MGIVRLSSHSSLFCPLTLNSSLGLRPGPPVALPNVLYNTEWQYHSSAVLAVTVDTLTAAYRTSSCRLSMTQLAETLNFCGRKVTTAASSLPFPVGPSTSLPDSLFPYLRFPPWIPLSASGGQHLSEGGRSFSQLAVMRGVSVDPHISHNPAGTRPRSALHSGGSNEDVLQCYLQTVFPGAVSVANVLQSQCILGPTFPQFFSPYVTKDGFTMQEPLKDPPDVHSIPVLAALQTTPALEHTLLSLYHDLKKVDVRRWPSWFTAGTEESDFQEALNDLRTLAYCYSNRPGHETDDSD
ncbi:hypothetical protein GDO86_019399 [Hymenochirus boettgeri]|nr:hypothetical protein GDO86_019399 [Hymenochirus boettgeri]